MIQMKQIKRFLSFAVIMIVAMAALTACGKSKDAKSIDYKEFLKVSINKVRHERTGICLLTELKSISDREKAETERFHSEGNPLFPREAPTAETAETAEI